MLRCCARAHKREERQRQHTTNFQRVEGIKARLAPGLGRVLWLGKIKKTTTEMGEFKKKKVARPEHVRSIRIEMLKKKKLK